MTTKIAPKVFARHRSVDEIKALCQAAGIECDTRKYDEGSDFITVHSKDKDGNNKAHVIYSSFNGHFFGTSPDGVEFSYDDENLDGTPWFDALLNFFYTDEPLKKETAE